MLSSLLMAAFVAQASEEGFSKLQIFMQQLIDWGVGAGGRIIGAVIIFVVGRFLISFIKKLVSKLLIIRKSKFPQNPKRSVRFSGKRTKRSVQKRKARNTQKAETKVL